MSILIVVEGGSKYVEQGTKTKNCGNIGHTPLPSHPPKIVDLFSLVKHVSVLVVDPIILKHALSSVFRFIVQLSFISKERGVFLSAVQTGRANPQQ